MILNPPLSSPTGGTEAQYTDGPCEIQNTGLLRVGLVWWNSTTLSTT